MENGYIGFGRKRHTFIDRPVKEVVVKETPIIDPEATQKYLQLIKQYHESELKHFEELYQNIRNFNKKLEEMVMYDFDIDEEEFE